MMACILEPAIDQPTFDLIVQLQLQDADLYFESSKGKSREPTDEDLAFHLQNEEWESICQFLEDRRMAMSFAAAVQADGQVLAESQVEEENASKDRDFARRWADDRRVMPPSDVELDSAALDDETLAKLQILYVSNSGDMDADRPMMSELNHLLKLLDEMVAHGRKPVNVWLAGSRSIL
jgi:hypothetical protein